MVLGLFSPARGILGPGQEVPFSAFTPVEPPGTESSPALSPRPPRPQIS